MRHLESELYSVILHESALPGRSNYGFTEEEIVARLDVLGIQHKKITFSSCGHHTHYDALELLPPEAKQKNGTLHGCKDLPQWLPQLIAHLKDRGISLFITASLNKHNDVQNGNETIFNLEHLSITKDSTGECQYKVIVPVRQLFTGLAEPFTVALIRSTLKKAKDSSINLKDEIYNSLANFLHAENSETFPQHDTNHLRSKKMRVETLLSDAPTLFMAEDTVKASVTLTRLTHKLELSSPEEYAHGSVWTFSDPDLLSKLTIKK